MKIIRIDGTTINESTADHTPVDVAMWYDRRLKLWTLYPVDSEGNQLRQASYATRKDKAMILKKDIEAEIESGNREGYYYE
jgi:hypothetical protein